MLGSAIVRVLEFEAERTLCPVLLNNPSSCCTDLLLFIRMQMTLQNNLLYFDHVLYSFGLGEQSTCYMSEI